MAVAAPAVFRFDAGVAIGEQIDGRLRVEAGFHVTLIFIGKRAVVVFQMVEHVHGAMLGIINHADADVVVVDEDLEIVPEARALDVVVTRHRDHRAVGKAAQPGERGLTILWRNTPKALLAMR